jgi:hypothetical protein
MISNFLRFENSRKFEGRKEAQSVSVSKLCYEHPYQGRNKFENNLFDASARKNQSKFQNNAFLMVDIQICRWKQLKSGCVTSIHSKIKMEIY